MNPCPDLATWEQLADGATPAGDAESLRTHLSSCAPCRVAYDRVRANQRLLDPLRAAIGPDGPRESPKPDAPQRAEGGSLRDGDIIDGYRIIRHIGGGGMGEVYLAIHDGRDYTRQVALKVLRPGLNTEGL
ncbi:MAG: zf-HC2 domain-containing protein, partial [Planctomycetota bacterium]